MARFLLVDLNFALFCYKISATRPWLNWIEQQISNLWVAGSSPAGRAKNSKPPKRVVLFCATADENRKKVAQQRQVRKQLVLQYFQRILVFWCFAIEYICVIAVWPRFADVMY